MKLLLVLALVLTPNIFCASYFVATTGNDGNVGSSGSPWLTLEKAATVVVAGDTVTVQDGTYPGNCADATVNSVDLTAAGTSPSPIIFQAANRGLAILDAQGSCAYYFKVHNGANYNTISGFKILGAVTGGIFNDNSADHTSVLKSEIYNQGNVIDYSKSGGHVGILNNSTTTNAKFDSLYIHNIGRTNTKCGVLAATTTGTYTNGSTIALANTPHLVFV